MRVRRSSKPAQRRRSAEEIAAIVAAFEESGETRAAFCRRRGLSASTLDAWRKRARVKARSARLVPVTVVPAAPATPCEVVLTNGRRLVVDPTTIEADALSRLLRAVDPLC